MATAVFELTPTPLPLDDEAPEATDTESAPRGPTARSGNSLAAAVLLLAVEDYQQGNELNHDTARKFLYPENEAAKDHLALIVGLMDGLSIGTLRQALDRMRDHWLTERRNSDTEGR